MKTNFRLMMAFLCSVSVLFSISACIKSRSANAPPEPAALGEEHNKAIVQEYFTEILDGKQYTKMPEVMTPNVVMHRPEGDYTYVGVIQETFQKGLGPHMMETSIHEMVASGDYVSVRLSHKLTYSSDEAFMMSRLGRLDARGKTVTWDAMAMFRFKDGKIAEEWVSNDELCQLMQLGRLEFSDK
jgi:predicted SnoaL-like aldol condensation-catalyzing enzyme